MQRDESPVPHFAVMSLGFDPIWYGVLLTMLGLALRRIDPLWVAAQIDKSHQLNDRLSSALQFAVGRSSLAPTETARGLAELAVQDAARVARDVKPAQAAPWQKPPLLPNQSYIKNRKGM